MHGFYTVSNTLLRQVDATVSPPLLHTSEPAISNSLHLYPHSDVFSSTIPAGLRGVVEYVNQLTRIDESDGRNGAPQAVVNAETVREALARANASDMRASSAELRAHQAEIMRGQKIRQCKHFLFPMSLSGSYSQPFLHDK